MNQNIRTKIDIIIVLGWIISYVFLTIYGLKQGWNAGTIALWLSILTPIVFGVRSMCSSWFFGYPILKPVVVHETGNIGTGTTYLKLKNEGTEDAKAATAWLLIDDGSIEELDCELLAQIGYVIPPSGFVKADVLRKVGNEEFCIKIETMGGISKKRYCACRMFKKGKSYGGWTFDKKYDCNSKPYWFKFKPCKSCKFLEEADDGKVVSNE